MRKAHRAVAGAIAITAVGFFIFGAAASAQDAGFAGSAFSDAWQNPLQGLFTPPNLAPRPSFNYADKARELSRLRAGYQRAEWAQAHGRPVDYNSIEQYYAVQGQPTQ